MPNSEPLTLNLQSVLVAALLFTLFAESARTWLQVWLAWRARRPWLEWSDQPRADWSRFAEHVVLGLIGLWLASAVSARLIPATHADRSEPMGTFYLLESAIVFGGIALLLPAILFSSHRPLVEYGITLRSLRNQIRDGVSGFLLSVLPMAAMMVVAAPLRTPDTQNPLLRILAQSANPIDIFLICLLAVVIAPLNEEMMFRVILQGWLTTFVRPSLAILLVALLFAGIHGAVDGIALVPLAAVLGYVFHRRHSYLSVVVIHFLFNATMLVLQVLTQSSRQITNP